MLHHLFGGEPPLPSPYIASRPHAPSVASRARPPARPSSPCGYTAAIRATNHTPRGDCGHHFVAQSTLAACSHRKMSRVARIFAVSTSSICSPPPGKHNHAKPAPARASRRHAATGDMRLRARQTSSRYISRLSSVLSELTLCPSPPRPSALDRRRRSNGTGRRNRGRKAGRKARLMIQQGE